jgi:hypothetical protein
MNLALFSTMRGESWLGKLCKTGTEDGFCDSLHRAFLRFR